MSRCQLRLTEPVFRNPSKRFEQSADLVEGGPVTTPDPTPVAERVAPRWQDPALPTAERVELLLEQMTLEEKVAQLGSRWIGGALPDAEADPGQVPAAGDGNNHTVAPMQDVFAAGRTLSLEAASRHGLGHLTRIFGSAPVTAVEGAAELVRQQRVVLDHSRLRIPALVHEECLTGFTTFGATVYPAAIAWGATFDPDLVERMAAAIGRDMAAVGVHQGLSPVLDVVRDYRWGRVEETMGEDPYLVSVLGAAYVRGLQSDGVIATLKHFAGYSAARAGRNHGPVPMGRRELMDVILPPFETAVALAGAGSVMNSYSDVDGVPAGADHWLLTDLLREEWGFAGSVVSDYWAVPFLASMHRIAADIDDAGAKALAAGIDVELPDTIGFGPGLVERVRRGELPEALVDRAACRLLTQKAQLGLLDADWTPEGSVAGAAAVDLDSPANRALAREMAERSVVLLEAGPALPLLGEGRPAPRRVAVVGPCAADPRVFMGCYAFPNHVLPRHPGLGLGLGVQTDLLDELVETGTPVVVVVVPGRPYALGDVQGRAAGLVQAFMPGEEGGPVIAGVLSGRIQPSGKLPVQIPKRPGGQPRAYLQPPLGGPESTGISTLDATPLYPFGYGGSYTTFEVDALRISEAEVPTDGAFTVAVRVRNTGPREGDEVVQLYLRDLVAEVARPVRQLTGFARVGLAPGQAVDVTFRVHADRTAYTNRELQRIVEPGDIEVLVGTSAVDLPCRGRVRLTGSLRVVGHDRQLITAVELSPVAGDTVT